MGLFDKIKATISSVQGKLPENMNSVDKIKARAQTLSQQHGDQIDKAADGLKTKIPGQTDDKIIDAAQKQLKKLNR